MIILKQITLITILKITLRKNKASVNFLLIKMKKNLEKKIINKIIKMHLIICNQIKIKITLKV